MSDSLGRMTDAERVEIVRKNERSQKRLQRIILGILISGLFLFFACSWLIERQSEKRRGETTARIDSLLFDHQFTNLIDYFKSQGLNEDDASYRARNAWKAMDMDGETILQTVEEARN